MEPVSVLYRLLRLTTVVSVSHVDLKIDRAMKTPRSLAGETEVSLTRAMAETSRGHRDEQGHDARRRLLSRIYRWSIKYRFAINSPRVLLS